MLDAFGRGYVMEHCIAAFLQDAEDRIYRAYVTDALMIIAENTAKFAGGRYLQKRWMDHFDDLENGGDDEKSGDEIAAEVIKRAGLQFGRDGEN